MAACHSKRRSFLALAFVTKLEFSHDFIIMIKDVEIFCDFL